MIGIVEKVVVRNCVLSLSGSDIILTMTGVLMQAIKRIDCYSIASFIIPLSVYMMTLAPSVTFFDSGEFMTAIYSLGSAHSPGYPLFINYANPFTYIPFGSIAFRVNIATAVSASAACYAVYLLVVQITESEKVTLDISISVNIHKLVALASACCFAFSDRLWLQSNHDKPYPLVSFFAAIILVLILKWRKFYQRGEERFDLIYLGAFLCGLAFCTHQTIVLLIPAFIFLVLSLNWRLILRIKELIIALSFMLFGLSVHLHLPLRATRNPLLNWGDAKTFEQFLWHFFRKGYPVDKPDREISLLWAQLKAFNIINEFTWGGCLLLSIGVMALFRFRKAEVVAYLISIVTFLLVIVGYFNTPADLIFLTEEFFTPIYLLTAVFIGVGFFTLIQIVFSKIDSMASNKIIISSLIILILAILPSTIGAINYRENDQHENYIAFDYASNTLRSLPPKAVLYTWGDSGAFPLWYLQGVEKMREDLDILHTPHLVFIWYLDAFPELFQNSILRNISLYSQQPDNILKLSIAEQIKRRPVYIDFSTRYSISFDEYTLQQQGICYQVEEKTGALIRQPDIRVWDRYVMRGLSDGEMFFRDLDTSKAILIYANSHLESGDIYMRLGRFYEGERELRAAQRISPELAVQIRQILGRYSMK